uniref:Uncharacterized protein n=1 Tax=Bionectria ochroleuca TaxID=29856 RepID=A0A8H7K562_BIOOC
MHPSPSISRCSVPFLPDVEALKSLIEVPRVSAIAQVRRPAARFMQQTAKFTIVRFCGPSLDQVASFVQLHGTASSMTTPFRLLDPACHRSAVALQDQCVTYHKAQSPVMSIQGDHCRTPASYPSAT